MYNIRMIRINLYITKKQFDALKKLAQNGTKMSELIRRAIDEYLENHSVK